MKNSTQQRFSIQENNPVDWFEPLYAGSNKKGEGVPWANMDTHPSFKRWLAKNPLVGAAKTALVVGCGMGDDAIALERLGFDVTAFDVSHTAIKLCKERFAQSKVNFVQADLLHSQGQWAHQFDFVLEIYTVQALPPKYERQLIESIAGFVADSGKLLVIAEVSNHPRHFANGPPWLLTPHHIDTFVSHGLSLKNTDIDGTQTYVTVFEGARQKDAAI